jgi:phosphatidylglycerol---prolipoprotein diacylglyceryl transferase
VIDPVAFEIGPLQVHWYGIIIAGAVLAGGALGTRVARWLNEDPDDGWSMLLLVIVFAVIGARLYHVIHLWEYYAANPILIPQSWNGGLGIPGGVAGGALGIFIYTRARGLSTARWMDIFAPALLLGQAIGRLGNFVNQELYGPPISECGNATFPPCLPWGIPIDAEHRAGTPWVDLAQFPPDTTVFVPLFAYEAVLNLIGMAVLLFVIRRYAPRLFAGDAVLMYLIWYGSVRTLLETYRVGNWTIIGLPTAMWVGIIAVVLSAAWFWYRHRRGWGSPMIRPDDPPAPDEAPAATTQPEASAG